MSESLSEVPASKLPFGSRREEQQVILSEMKDFIYKTRLIGKPPKSKLMDFQLAIIQTCNAIPLMLEELEKRFPNERVQLKTYRLNQDIVERFFSYFRAIDSSKNTNPDVLGSKRRLKRIVFGKNLESIMRGRKTNVAPEDVNFQKDFLTSTVCIIFQVNIYFPNANVHLLDN